MLPFNIRDDFAAVHESGIGRLCCKSRRHLVRSPKTGNIRIRRIEFLNQNSLFGLDLEKVFFAPGLKIVLQHYRPGASFSAMQLYVRR
jgi:hypothetical protein